MSQTQFNRTHTTTHRTLPKLPLPMHAPFLNLNPAAAAATSLAADFLGVGREGD
jgi:hypothetical protein